MPSFNDRRWQPVVGDTIYAKNAGPDKPSPVEVGLVDFIYSRDSDGVGWAIRGRDGLSKGDASIFVVTKRHDGKDLAWCEMRD